MVLAGTTVKRATLHNFEEIKRKDIRLGDHVTVEKAGEVIPAVLGVVLKARTAEVKEIEPPRQLSRLRARLSRGTAFSCVARIARARRRRNASCSTSPSAGRWTSTAWARPWSSNWSRRNWCATPADFYDLTPEKLSGLERMAEKSAQNVLDGNRGQQKAGPVAASFRSGHPPCRRGIRAGSLAAHFGSLDKIAAAGAEELQSVRDVGDVLAESVVTWFGSEENRRLIERLRAAGVNLTAQQQPAPSGVTSFAGKIFVLTGTLTEPRDVVADRIRAAGGARWPRA